MDTERVVLVGRGVSVMRKRTFPRLETRCRVLPGVKGCFQYQPLFLPQRVWGFGRLMKWLNCYLLRAELDTLIGGDSARMVIYDSPTQDCLAGTLGESHTVYLAIDDRTVTVSGEAIRGDLEAERRLLRKVHQVICVSETLAEVLRSRMAPDGQKPIHVLPNGYDERIFDPQKTWDEPATLRSLPRPRVLVAGYVSERIDWEGVEAVVKCRPEWTWVFVGPAERGMREKIECLAVRVAAAGRKSVTPASVWHEPVPASQIPAFIAHSDACAMPYRMNAFTRCSSPVKPIEYLAMGMPVLSTRVPALEKYGGVVQWVNQGDGHSYALALDHLAATRGDAKLREARLAAVAGDTWASRAVRFRELVLDGVTESEGASLARKTET